jgi:hypothetical protein
MAYQKNSSWGLRPIVAAVAAATAGASGAGRFTVHLLDEV